MSKSTGGPAQTQNSTCAARSQPAEGQKQRRDALRGRRTWLGAPGGGGGRWRNPGGEGGRRATSRQFDAGRGTENVCRDRPQSLRTYQIENNSLPQHLPSSSISPVLAYSRVSCCSRGGEDTSPFHPRRAQTAIFLIPTSPTEAPPENNSQGARGTEMAVGDNKRPNRRPAAPPTRSTATADRASPAGAFRFPYIHYVPRKFNHGARFVVNGPSYPSSTMLSSPRDLSKTRTVPMTTHGGILSPRHLPPIIRTPTISLRDVSTFV